MRTIGFLFVEQPSVNSLEFPSGVYLADPVLPRIATASVAAE